jgi:hypothetical protein
MKSVLYTKKKKRTHFATKSSEIIISSKRAGSTLKKGSLQTMMILDFVIQGLYDTQVKTNKFSVAIMYSCMWGVFILKKIHKQKSEKMLEVEIPFSFSLVLVL